LIVHFGFGALSSLFWGRTKSVPVFLLFKLYQTDHQTQALASIVKVQGLNLDE